MLPGLLGLRGKRLAIDENCVAGARPREVDGFAAAKRVVSRGNERMDRDTKGTFYRRNVPETASMKTEGRIEDLVRMFKVLPSTTQREYNIVVDGREYGPNDIDNFAREFGIEG